MCQRERDGTERLDGDNSAFTCKCGDVGGDGAANQKRDDSLSTISMGTGHTSGKLQQSKPKNNHMLVTVEKKRMTGKNS